MRLAELLARQAGMVSLAQAAGAGVSGVAVRRRVAAGAWERVHPRVFRVAGHPATDESRVWAASLWAGRHGVLSGPAAAFAFGMRARAPERIQVTVPAASRRRPTPGITLRRRDLPHVDRSDRRGLRVTGRELTVLETTLAVQDGVAFLDRALQRHVDLRALVVTYHRNLGARGWSRLRPLLVAAHDRTASDMERRAVRLLRDAGLTGWVTDLRIGGWRADIAFPERRVAIELDGLAWHVDTDRFQNDRSKGNALAVDRWTVLRFTWRDVTERPAHVTSMITRALAQAA